METKRDKALSLLRDHADDLRRQIREAQLVRTSPPTDRLEFIAGAIDRYLNGKVPSLDRALGVEKGPGNPGSKGGQPGKHFRMVLEVAALRDGERTWTDLCEAVREEFDFNEGPDALHKIHDREIHAALEWYGEQCRTVIKSGD